MNKDTNSTTESLVPLIALYKKALHIITSKEYTLEEAQTMATFSGVIFSSIKQLEEDICEKTSTD